MWLVVSSLALAEGGDPGAGVPAGGQAEAISPVAETVVIPPSFEEPPVLAWPADQDPALGVQEVVLGLRVGETGSLDEVAPVSGNEPFVAAALTAAHALRFRPATADGDPVAVEIPLTLVFVPPPLSMEGIVRIAGGAATPAAGLALVVGDRAVTTREDGRFAVHGIPDGIVEVRSGDARYLVAADVEIRAGTVVRAELWARPDRYDEGVVGEYRRARDVVDRRVVTAEDIRTQPGTLGDPVRAAHSVPGVIRTPLDAGWILLRGGELRHTGVYIDGIRVPLAFHLGGFTSVLQPVLVDRVEVIAGGQPARYGKTAAGAVDVITKDAPEGVHARLGANLVFASAFLGVPLPGDWNVSAGVRRSYLDAIFAAAFPGVATAAAAAPQFWDWQARFSRNGMGVTGLGYSDTLAASDTIGNSLEVTFATHRLHGAWWTELGDVHLEARPYLAYERRSLEIPEIDIEDSRESVGGGARVELSSDPGSGLRWSGGIDGDLVSVDIEVQSMEGEFEDVAWSRWVGSPDLYGDVGFGERARVALGARLDTLFVDGQHPRVGPSPRGTVAYDLVPWLTLGADLGVYHQPPPVDMVVGPPEGAAFELERAFGGGVSADARRGPWTVRLSGYARALENVSGFEADGSIDQGAGQAYGAEVDAKLALARLGANASYAYSRSLRREDGGPFDPVAAGSDGLVPSLYDQPHAVTAGAVYDLGRNWTVAGRWRYASGFYLPVVDRDGQVTDVLDGTEDPLRGDAEQRLEAFHALDLKVTKRFLFRRWRLEAFLDLQNVYNHRVPEPISAGLGEVYVAHSYGYGLPVLPVIGFEGILGS